MARTLVPRGPEGTNLLVEDGLALGHTLLATTPEATREVMPFADPDSGCAITADARLDNREELLAALRVGPGTGDGELILRAYLAWGEGCLDRLLGDFAFVLWDRRARKLVAARDQMGMRPLAYAHVPSRLLALASEPRAVLDAEGVPHALNEGRVADYLEGYLEGIDLTSTFYQGVLRLPPAHVLTVTGGRLAVRRYWSLEAGPELRLGSDDAYAEAFRDVLTQAVRSRLRSAGPVGSMLSGGMDSGSVTAVASRLLAEDGRGPLPTFSLVGPDPSTCVETRAIRAAMTMPGLDPHILDWAQPDLWRGDLIPLLQTIGEPFDGHINLLRGVYGAARHAGVKVVLDGVGGDLVLAHGDRVPRLIRSLRVQQAWKEARLWSPEASAWCAFRPHLRQALTPRWVRRLRRGWRDRRHAVMGYGLVATDFAHRVDLAGRQARDRASDPLPWEPLGDSRAQGLTRAFLTAGRERYDRVAGSLGVEPRDPFLDRRVMDFCLRLPSDQLAAEGWTKIVLRRAMAGLLPDEVRWRRGKEHLGYTLTGAMFRAWPGWEDVLAEARPVLDRWVRPEVFAARDPKAPGLAHLDIEEDRRELVYLALWLKGAGAAVPLPPGRG